MTEEEWLACAAPRPMLELLAGVVDGKWPSLEDVAARADATAGVAWLCLSCACCRTRCSRSGGLCPAYRKLRLFALACGRRVLPMLRRRSVCVSAIEAAERYADGLVEEKSWVAAANRFDGVRRKRFPKYATSDDGAWNAVYCAVHRRWEGVYDETFAWDRWRIALVVALDAAKSSGAEEPSVQADFLRDLFGHPFRPVSLDPAWVTPTVRSLVAAAYEDRTLPSGNLDLNRLSILADALEEAGCTDRVVLDHLHGPGPHVRGCFVVDLCLNYPPGR